MNRSILCNPLLVSLFIINGCVSIASYQTAETLKQGRYRSVIGLGLKNDYHNDRLSLNIGEDTPTSSQQYLGEYILQYGITDWLQLSGHLLFPSGTGFDSKFRYLWGDFSAAIGIGYFYGVQSVKGADGNDNQLEVEIQDYRVPLYFSYRFGTLFSIYTIPKYVYRTLACDITKRLSLAGGDIGMIIGQDWGTILEYSFLADTKSAYYINQISLGAFF